MTFTQWRRREQYPQAVGAYILLQRCGQALCNIEVAVAVHKRLRQLGSPLTGG